MRPGNLPPRAKVRGEKREAPHGGERGFWFLSGTVMGRGHHHGRFNSSRDISDCPSNPRKFDTSCKKEAPAKVVGRGSQPKG